MPIPPAGRARLAKPLVDLTAMRPTLRTSHTLPIAAAAWNRHAAALAMRLLHTTTLLGTSIPDDFEGAARERIAMQEHGSTAVSHLLALQPFSPFDHHHGEAILGLLNRVYATAADWLRTGARSLTAAQELADLAERALPNWAMAPDDTPQSDLVADAFAMTVPPVDDMREFRADWVLQHYAYRTGDLIEVLLPHLRSIGVPDVRDLLASLNTIGWIVTCEDPASAYVTFDEFLNALLSAQAAVSARVTDHLADSEPYRQRSRQGASQSLTQAIAAAQDDEERAMRVVDAYKRLTEGPFRQLSCSLHCLQTNSWREPPMLTSLGEQLRKAGDNLAVVADAVIVPGLRNSEAHEAIAWDGYADRITAAGESIHPHRVAQAVVSADAFTRGAEAGLAIARSLDLPPEQTTPSSNDPNRMASWRRAQAFFGTNQLRVVAGTTNSRRPHLTLDRLDTAATNPAFQALTTAHLLLPQTEKFTIGTPTDPELVSVHASAIEMNLPTWTRDTSRLDRMPLSGFLVINLDARRAVEDDRTAIRAAAWIAIDDTLDAIDGMTAKSPSVDGALLQERLALVTVALECVTSYWGLSNTRIASTQHSLQPLQADFAEQPSIASRSLLRNPATLRIREQ